MANAFIPREIVHEWSETIGNNTTEHQASLTRLLKAQRRLTRWIEENRAHMEGTTAGVCLYLTGVVIRMFDLAGGRLRSATWADVRNAEQNVAGIIGDLLPLDDEFPKRFRAVSRAQPHILDEATMALFEREQTDEEEVLAKQENLKILMLLWVVTEVLDENWHPPRGYEGETVYRYVHIEPTDEDSASTETSTVEEE